MKDPKPTKIEAEIERPAAVMTKKQRELTDPRQREILAQYELIAGALQRLNALDESVLDSEGRPVIVYGKSYRASSAEVHEN